MFAVEKVSNIFVATCVETFSMPEYLFQLPNLLNTLDALYRWRNHHHKLEDLLLLAVVALKENAFFFPPLLVKLLTRALRTLLQIHF